MLTVRIPNRAAIPAVVLAIAAGLRLWGLASPPQLYWDEQFYVFDAEVYLGGGIGQPIRNEPEVKIADEGTWVHPPGGKWIIALLGVGPLGDRPIGWRLPSAVFGIAGVALLYLLALRLWKSVWWAGFVAFMLALDGLHIVQSRIAMLDIFLTTFITAGLLFVVLDRERMDSAGRRERWPRIERLFGSPDRLWAGVFLGAAVATKWSGAFALVLAAVCCSVWSFTGSKYGDRSMSATIGTLFTSFVMVPIGVYLLSYGSFFFQHGPAIGDFLTLQLRMLRYQLAHIQLQPENSKPWTWPVLLHPVTYLRTVVDGTSSSIVALGNPVLWWGFLASLPMSVVGLRHSSTWRDAVCFGGYAATYLPWLVVGRTQFIWYMLPAVPFMCLCLAAGIRRFPAQWAARVAIASAAMAALVALAFSPVWTGWWVPRWWSNALTWLPDWKL